MTELSVLEMYILSCLDQGMQTKYDLLRNASLSLGASTPALKRLAKAGMVSRKNKKGVTARPRYEYTPTDVGNAALRSGISSLLTTAGDQDIDSVLRIVHVAGRHGATTKGIAAFLKRAAEHRDRLAKHAAVESEYKGWDYPGLKRAVDAGRLKAEAKAIAELARRAASTRSRDVNASRT